MLSSSYSNSRLSPAAMSHQPSFKVLIHEKHDQPRNGPERNKVGGRRAARVWIKSESSLCLEPRSHCPDT
jgi:hypothetical protein